MDDMTDIVMEIPHSSILLVDAEKILNGLRYTVLYSVDSWISLCKNRDIL